MALFRSRSTEFLSQKRVPSTTRQLQEALYTLLDDLEKSAFIEVLSMYGSHRDIFELVNSLKKILNTPIKRQLFPLVRKVIRHEDVEAFDLLTRRVQHTNPLTLPYLYTPHMADLNVMNKYQTPAASVNHRSALTRSWAETTSANRERRYGITSNRFETLQKVGGVRGQDVKHKTLFKSSLGSKKETVDDIVEIDIGEPDSRGQGYGFTIRGGLETGVGVYISSVDKGGPAHRQGVTVGDHILEANNISFRNITHEEAAKIITASTRLQMTVSRAGRVPGSHVVHETYSWTDPKGRPVSPPTEWNKNADGEDDGRGRSASQMLKCSDERKINLVVQKGQGLGIMIRGGKEYDLGIFVSGIDPFSVAENAGVKLGDQILDANGRSFLDVTHSEAVNHLKASRHLILTVKDVGKIPFAKTTIDERGWIESTNIGTYSSSLTLSSRKSASGGSVTDREVNKKSFLRGVGTQLMLSSTLGKAKQREQIHDQAKLLLNETEHANLNYYLSEYEKKVINIWSLVHALLELFNTSAKFTMLSEIRATVQPTDLDIFDQLVAKKDLERSLKQARLFLTPNAISFSSDDSTDLTDQDEYQKHVYRATQWMDELEVEDRTQTLEMKHRKLGSFQGLSRSTPDLSHGGVEGRLRLQARPLSRSPRSAFRMVTSTDDNAKMDQRSHAMTFDRDLMKGKDDPSDDSGVEISGGAQQGAALRPGYGLKDRDLMYTSLNTRQSQKPNSRELSDPQKPNSRELSNPQKKILNHLQVRSTTLGNTIRANKSSQNVHFQMKEDLPYTREIQHPVSTITHTKTFDNLDKRLAETKKGQVNFENKEDDDDFFDILPFEQEMDSPSDSPRVTGVNSQRSHIQTGYNDRSRSKYKSKSPYGAQESGDNKHFEDSDVDSKTHVGYIDPGVPQNEVSSHTNRDIRDTSFKPQPLMPTQPRKHRGRRDKSPFKKMWENWRQNRADVSTRTTQSSNKSQSTLTINGQIMAASTQAQDGNMHSIDTSQQQAFAQTSSTQQFGKEQENRKQHTLHSPTEYSANHAHQIPTAIDNPADIVRDENRPAPNSDTANKESKRVFFASARKGSLSDQVSAKVSVSTSPRYKSPRRDKQISKINVPLIRKNTDFLDIVDSVSLSESVNEQRNNNITPRQNYLTVNQSDDLFSRSQESFTRATMSHQKVIGKETVTSHKGTRFGDVTNSGVVRRNTTCIFVGGQFEQDPSSAPIDVIKKKAAEKYGEIPLDVIYIYRSKPTLGVAIEGGANTRQPLPKVINVQPGGSAFESGGLKVGHVILEVNSQPVVGLAHMDAARLIAEAFKNTSYNRMELLVTEWTDRLLDTIKVQADLLEVQ